MKTIIALLLLAASPALADPKAESKKHVDKATKAHADGKFDVALNELTLAYTLDPQPMLLYAIGQVHVKLGHCSEAIDFYQRFLASNPGAGPAAEAREAIETCKNEPPPVEEAPPQPPPPAQPQPQLPPPPPPPPPPTTPAFYTDVLGDALVGAGLVSAVVGIVEYKAALSDLDTADKQTTYGAHQKYVNDANGARTLSLVFGLGGAALVGAGIAHYVLHDRSESHGVAIVPARGGGLVTWSGRF
jgi:hypothetical protein